MNYELAFLASPNFSQAEADDFFKKIESLIQKGGEIIQKENLKKLRLWYPIKKQKEAYFGSFDFSGIPESMIELNFELKKEDSILRFLIIRKEPNKQKELVKRVKKIKDKPGEKEEKKESQELKEFEEKIDEMIE